MNNCQTLIRISRNGISSISQISLLGTAKKLSKDKGQN